MNHLPTTVLLDMADDFASLRDLAWTHQRRESAMLKLAQIDEELLSRMPEGKFLTLLDNEPVGFEPYIPDEDSDWLFDALYGHIVPTVDEMG